MKLLFGIGMQLYFVKTKLTIVFGVWDGCKYFSQNKTIRDEIEGLGEGYIFDIAKFKDKNLVHGKQRRPCYRNLRLPNQDLHQIGKPMLSIKSPVRTAHGTTMEKRVDVYTLEKRNTY